MSLGRGQESRASLRSAFIEEFPKLPAPDVPRAAVPQGACDSHAHVFGPWDRFPLAAERTYTPQETPAKAFISMLDVVGVEYGVLVQPTVHAVDNSCMLDALSLDRRRLRGVAVVSADATFEQLRQMKDAGVEGIRLSDVSDEHGNVQYKNVVPIEAFVRLKKYLIDLDMHVQFFVEGKALPKYEQLIRDAQVPIVIDHMGRPDVREGVNSPHFQTLCRLLSEGLVWIKTTQYRPSKAFPTYDDVRPFFEKLVSVNPDALVWGSDWPHINMTHSIPNPGMLLDVLSDWTGDPVVYEKILCSNPKRLYRL